jgi:hypothetical protein
VFWALGLFVLVQQAFGLLLDHRWSWARHPRLAAVHDRLRAERPPPDVVVLGSSRFLGQVNGPLLNAVLRRELGPGAPSAFNASVAAGDPLVFERMVDRLCREGRRPRLLVVEVSPEGLHHSPMFLEEGALRLLTWGDLPEALPALCRRWRVQRPLFFRLFPLYAHRYELRKAAREALPLPEAPRPAPPAWSDEALLALPSAPRPLTPQMLAAQQEGADLVRRVVRGYRIGGPGPRALERLLRRCRDEGVPVVLVGVPVCSAVNRLWSEEADGQFLAYMARLTSAGGCCFIDLRRSVPDPYFIDCWHVAEEGGAFFTRVLAREVILPAWAGERPVVSSAGVR